MKGRYVASIDQGTASSRCFVFDDRARIVSVAQHEHRQHFPRPGWVEHDPEEIWHNVELVVRVALDKADLSPSDLCGVGIANQRETTVLWDRRTGAPVHNAINWQDTRADRICRQPVREHGQEMFRDKTGLPVSTYFSGPKIRWLLDHIPGLTERAEAGEVLFGTIDSWLIWNLTGGADGGRHVTDVTNASRTLLMNLHTLDWDPVLLDAIGVPAAMLPEIRASSETYGEAGPPIAGVPVASALGDQHAALVGQTCFNPGEAKCTFGTGSFFVLNTGDRPVTSNSGLLTTLAYKLGSAEPAYALEVSIAITGALVQWFRDNLGLITSAPEIETLAASVEDNGGCYFVPAFSGLFAPYWRDDARGAIVGLTRYVNKGHIARAVLEATAFQTKEVLDAMNADSGVDLTALKVDGGMLVNETLMQFHADILGVPVIRPVVAETTALGAAYAAGLAVGFWQSEDDIRNNWAEDKRWDPQMDAAHRAKKYAQWKKAVTKSFDWVDSDT